ncbi:PREDICTED: protein FAR1-RELATED SEQUENCE 5-like isoform X2 [Nelumbo nucifera]|uniref:Protein FAR1-RELATED SEQUENCE n=1 Tax=Nelumbo nucifera TaxID=4432 RepID=A0A1U8BB25_NELNU|nr:PREDICTED: protein FAR1-RELATED SEQUENCE 5-like isoform X2 [Nelumbo nucifera]
MEVDPHSTRRLAFEPDGDKHQHIDIANDLLESFDASTKNKLQETCFHIPEEWIPKVGMVFKTEDEAYDFYNRYAGKMGFSARKANRTLCNYTRETRFRKFCCFREGKRVLDKRRLNVKRPRPETRCGCMAEMKISRREDGFFHVIAFNEAHNHIIVSPTTAHMLRSQRKISKAQSAQAKMVDDSGMTPKASTESMAKCSDGCENVGFTSMDLNNNLPSCRTRNMKKGEAGGIIQYFQDMRLKDPSFVYAIQLDQAELVTNLFWADAQMIVDYGHFGDVVCFDTTCKTNNENRPFTLFVGVNNYKNLIIFGAALLYDETVDTFEWLFKTFIKTMGGKKPKTILTDDDAAMAKAINLVFPETHHRLCVWHMFQNTTKHLRCVIDNFEIFSKDFSSCVYDYENVDEFENAWESMINKYNLQENNWLRKLYNERHRWDLVFGRHSFSADISITLRNERMNGCLRKYLNIKHDLSRFLLHFEKVVADKRYEELKAEFAATQSMPTLTVQVEILKYVSRIYTPPIFSMFYNEVWQQLNCSIEEDHVVSETITEYIVSVSGKNRQYTVAFNSSDDSISCSCKKFDYIGILCGHALKVLDYRRIKMIPPRYILRRWTVDAKVTDIVTSCSSTISSDQSAKTIMRYREMYHLLIQIAKRAAPVEDAYKVVVETAEKLSKEVAECLKDMTFDLNSTAFNIGLQIIHTIPSLLQGTPGLEYANK